MTGPTPEILDDLVDRIDALPITGSRLLIAIAGPPAAGKSTFASALATRLNRDAPRAAIVPMDGFHLDNRILVDRSMLARKGSPETFDAVGFIHMIQRLRCQIRANSIALRCGLPPQKRRCADGTSVKSIIQSLWGLHSKLG